MKISLFFSLVFLFCFCLFLSLSRSMILRIECFSKNVTYSMNKQAKFYSISVINNLIFVLFIFVFVFLFWHFFLFPFKLFIQFKNENNYYSIFSRKIFIIIIMVSRFSFISFSEIETKRSFKWFKWMIRVELILAIQAYIGG